MGRWCEAEEKKELSGWFSWLEGLLWSLCI